MYNKFNNFIFYVLILFSFKLHSQFCTGPLNTNCTAGTSSSSISSVAGTNQNLTFDFDSFSKINGGITQYGSSIIKIKTFEAVVGSCNWTLKMNVSSSAAAAEWETLTNYGSSSGVIPPLNLIEFRVTNGCGTPLNNGAWQTFATLPITAPQGTSLDIINNAVITASTVPCTVGSQVNGAGSYLTNYNAYTFTVDYRIILAGFTYRPGLYVLKIEYCLSER